MTQKRITTILAFLLLLSLGGNFFQGGLIIGKNAEIKALGPVTLPPGDQKIIEDAMQLSKPKMDELRGKMLVAREDVQHAMDADPFDKEVFDAALKNLNDAKRTFLVYIQQQRAITLQKLSPEGRAMLERAAAQNRKQPAPQAQGQMPGFDFPPFIWEDNGLPD